MVDRVVDRKSEKQQQLNQSQRKHNVLLKLTSLMCYLIIGVVFGVAGIGKIASPDQFASDIAAYKLLPTFMIGWVALYLPWLEVMCVVGLCKSRWQRASLVWIGVMLLIFIFALTISWIRGLNLDCGCFGDLDRSGYAVTIGRDVILLLMAMFCVKD